MNHRLHKVTDDQIIEALEKNKGLIKQASESIEVSRDTIYRRMRENPEIKSRLVDIRDGVVDEVESKLYESAMNGEGWAITFFLKSLGRNRGYGDTLTINADITARTKPSLEGWSVEDLMLMESLYKKNELIIDSEFVE